VADDLRFEGRVAVVTGAGRGLGRTHALLLAARGASVVVNNRTPALAAEVAEEITAAGGRAVADSSDVSVPEEADALIATAVEAFGTVDIVVNNAGITGIVPFGDLSHAFFDQIMRINAGGHFNVTRAAWPHLVAQGYGRIVNTTSGAGIYGLTGVVSYATSKGAVNGLTRALAVEGRPFGILVNAISPGALTRMTESAAAVDEAMAEKWAGMRPELVSPVVAWLAHDSCTDSGEIYEVFGGRISLVLIGQTRGLYDPAITPESVRDHHHLIADEDGYILPETARDIGSFDTAHPVPR
jgi:NAD(P)-dependent dehydrogenase (short-subunit alcohol dehydrogenase family)